MDLSERKLKILQAIIGDFIRTAEPMGSRTLSKKFDMGLSPATIRNEMSDLEEMGYLTHPHTSAGRVPSDKAYRLYVNDLMEKRTLSEAEKQLIRNKLRSNLSELEKTVQHAARLLSEITMLTAFAITPSQEADKLKGINLLPVDERTVVLMIVAESGKVSNTTVRLKDPYSMESLELLSKSMTYTYKGKALSEVLTLDIIQTFRTDMEALSRLAANIMPNFLGILKRMLDVDLFLDGYSNIFSFPEYNDIDKAKMFLELLNKKEALTKTLMERDDGIMVTIGNENTDDRMQECSLITATYHIDGKLLGKLGVIGPTRMKYDEVISVIEYITENLSESFRLSGGEEQE